MQRPHSVQSGCSIAAGALSARRSAGAITCGSAHVRKHRPQSLQALPPGHRPYDAAEIARARQQPLIDVAAARGGLIVQARTRGIDLR